MTQYRIERKGNYGIINPVPQGILAGGLLKYMSYEKQGKEYMPNPAWAEVRLYNTKKGSFPWGLHKLVYRIFNKWCEENKEDTYFRPFDIKEFEDLYFTKELRYYQKDAVKSLMVNDGGIVCLPTGAGKTKTIIEYLRIMTKPSVVIVPTLDLKSQWEKQLIDMKHVKVINYQSKLAVELAKMCDIVVYDECHHVKAKTIYKIAMKTSTNTINVGCSATPVREDGEDLKVFGAIGEIVYNIDKRRLIDEGFLSDATVLYYSPQFDTSEDRFMNYQSIYQKHIVNNENRNKYIIENAQMYYNLGKKVLILVSQIEHGQYLYDNIKVDETVKIYCHGSSDNRDEDLTKYGIIIASNIFNEGVDLPSLDVLIIASGGTSSIQLTQKVGRVLRPALGKKAIIVDFMDNVKFLKKHSKKRREILEQDFEVQDV